MNALILGARSDIARAIARQAALKGWSLTLAARNAATLADEVNDLQIRAQAPVRAVEFDALDRASHAAFCAGLEPSPDIVFCVFGYLGDEAKARLEPDEAARILDTNYTGAVSVLDRLADDFEKRGRGIVVGISSVAGDRGRQSNLHYGSAKAGFSAYLAGLRNRLHSAGVQVLTVKPGFVRTRMTEGMKLPGLLTAEPEQVARAVLRAVEKKRNEIYTLWMWRWIMLVIRLIPEPLFKRLQL